MPVNDKMKTTIRRGFVIDPAECAQAVVNAAWHELDPDDESTWPKHTTPSDVFEWLVLCVSDQDGPWAFMTVWVKSFKAFHGVPEGQQTIYYADPSDLLYVPDVPWNSKGPKLNVPEDAP